MLSMGRRTSLALAGACLLLAARVSAQDIRTDQLPRSVTFAHDTLFQAMVVAHRVIQVRAEVEGAAPAGGTRARATPGRLTGRWAAYAVAGNNRTRLIAARQQPAADAPTIAFVSHGDPAVVVLTTYLGDVGRSRTPSYSFKVIIAEAEQFRAYTVVADSGQAYSGTDVKSFERGPSGSFNLRFTDGPSLRYRDRRLSLSTSGVER